MALVAKFLTYDEGSTFCAPPRGPQLDPGPTNAGELGKFGKGLRINNSGDVHRGPDCIHYAIPLVYLSGHSASFSGLDFVLTWPNPFDHPDNSFLSLRLLSCQSLPESKIRLAVPQQQAVSSLSSISLSSVLPSPWKLVNMAAPSNTGGMELDPKYDDYDYPLVAPVKADGHPGHLTPEQMKAVKDLRASLEAKGYTDRLDTLTLVCFCPWRRAKPGENNNMLTWIS